MIRSKADLIAAQNTHHRETVRGAGVSPSARSRAERLIETGAPPAGASFTYAIFDGQRWKTDLSGQAANGVAGRVYTGHLLASDGTADSNLPVQWKYVSDTGVWTLAKDDDYVFLLAPPAYVADEADWLVTATYGQRCWAILSPWAAARQVT